MNNSKIKQIFLLSAFLVLFISITANAQWYKLSAYTNPYAADSGAGVFFPIKPCVAGNGVILYGVEMTCISMGHCGVEAIMKSDDDLYSCKDVYTDGGLGSGTIYAIASKNDSTSCFIYSNYSAYYTNLIKYTNDNYTTVPTVDTIRAAYPGLIELACFSPDFIYSAWQNGDTLVINRSSVSPITNPKYNNLKYTAATNLYFVSDSIGFMLCKYNNNSAKSVLAKTSDSGKTWTDNFLDSLHVITGCSFPSAGIGYLTENNGNVYKTTDGGGTWIQLINPAPQLNCVSFSNDSLGYIGGNTGVLYKTINGGTSWTAEVINTVDVESLYTFGTVAYFIDANSNIYKNEFPMGITDLSAAISSVNIYPNPSNGIFQLEISHPELVSGSQTIEVYNILGEKVYSQSIVHSSSFIVNLSNQPNGVYLYRVIGETGNLVGKGKMVIQR